MGKRDTVMDLVKALSGQQRVLVIPRFYIDVCKGDHLAALLLNQILYWSDRTTDPDGWFSKSYPEWQEELAMTAYQVKRAIHGDNRNKQDSFCLTDIGVETDLRPSAHHQGAATLHYRINEDVLRLAISGHLDTPAIDEPNNVDPPQQCSPTPPNNVKGAPSTMLRTYTKSTTKSTTNTPPTPRTPTPKAIVPSNQPKGGEPTAYEFVAQTWFKITDLTHMSQNDKWNMECIMDEIESVVKEPTTDQLKQFIKWYWKEYPDRSMLPGEKKIAATLRLWHDCNPVGTEATVLSEAFDPFTGKTTYQVRKPDGTTAVVTR